MNKNLCTIYLTPALFDLINVIIVNHSIFPNGSLYKDPTLSQPFCFVTSQNHKKTTLQTSSIKGHSIGEYLIVCTNSTQHLKMITLDLLTHSFYYHDESLLHITTFPYESHKTICKDCTALDTLLLYCPLFAKGTILCVCVHCDLSTLKQPHITNYPYITILLFLHVVPIALYGVSHDI